MTQTWEHLLFVHWAVPPEVIRPLIPNGLEIDTFEGQAWIGILPFLLTGVRIRGLPPVPYTTTFPEINVRTYVKAKDQAGIYFLSLDASNPLITAIAKKWYRLPYYRAAMQFQKKEQGIDVQSRRAGSMTGERFFASYQPHSAVFSAQPGTVEHWLTERYTLFCECKQTNRIYAADVYHEPWQLQKASLQIHENSLTDRFFSLPKAPHLYLYSRGVQSIVWPIREVKAK